MAKISIQFEDAHLQVIIRALEVYVRFKMGQIDYALDMLTDNDINYEDRREIHNLIREKMFPDLHKSGQEYGIGNKETGDAQIAYEIQKVIDNYLSVKRNNGFWGDGTNFYPPLKYSGIPLPIIKNFKYYVDFEIDSSYYGYLNKYINKFKDFKAAWKIVDEWKLKSTYTVLKNIVTNDGSEIVPAGGKWYYRVHRPRSK